MLYKILLILAVIVLLVSYVVYRIAFYSPNKSQNDDYHISRGEQMDAQRETIKEMIDTLNNIPYEPVIIPADDGLRLRGRYYHQKDGAPVVIGFHGYRGTPSRTRDTGSASSSTGSGMNAPPTGSLRGYCTRRMNPHKKRRDHRASRFLTYIPFSPTCPA